MVVAMLIACLLFPALAGAAVDVGVYYYPGWRDDTPGSRNARPWDELRRFPEREPKLGYYAEGGVAVMNQQLAWMADAGLGFVVFDWYWNNKLGTLQSHALSAYYKTSNRSRIRHAILWANHTEFPEAAGEFENMVRYWRFYFRQPDYLRIDDKPVVFVFSAQLLEARARRFNSNTAELLRAARAIAREEGFPGIYFVGGAGAGDAAVGLYGDPEQGGYDAFSAYNYHGGAAYPGGHTESHSYAELDAGYREQWKWMLANAKVPYILPMTSGWDMRPWGGSRDPQHDDSLSTPDEFERHLLAGKALLETQRGRTRGMGVICCWNEFGEGSFIEPTAKDGDAMLARVRRVFGAAKPATSGR
jgi:hypothetical protein